MGYDFSIQYTILSKNIYIFLTHNNHSLVLSLEELHYSFYFGNIFPGILWMKYRRSNSADPIIAWEAPRSVLDP